MTVQRDNLLPPNEPTPFQDAQSQTSARLLDAPHQVIRDARKGATAPKQLLAFLAWERSVHHPTSDEAVMRQRIDSSFADHLSYGTPDALAAEIELDTGVAVRVVEYFEEPGLEWPDFVMDAEFELGALQPDVSGVMASALMRKNVRDWPAGVRLRPKQPVGDLFTGAATFVGHVLRIAPLDEAPPSRGLFIGAATRVIQSLRIAPL